MRVAASGERSAGCRWLATHVRPEEQPRLAVQGRVTWESLPSGRRCAKLRFRDAQGRQRVRYIGVDDELADSVSSALAQRQRASRLRRDANRLRRRCGQVMRHVKRDLEPHFAAAGWRFHGQAVRRRRHAKRCRPKHPINSPSLAGGLLPMTDMPETIAIEPTDSLSRRVGDDVRQWALEQQTPIVRALGYSAAGLVQLALSIKQPINDHLATADDPLIALEDFHPQIELALKLDRQFERYVQVIDRHAHTTANAAHAKKSPNDTDALRRPGEGARAPERAGPHVEVDPLQTLDPS